MNYPSHLLPHTDYKRIVWSDDLLFLYLIRHTSGGNLCFPDTRQINPDKIEFQSDHLRDLSTNLFGIFKIEDIYISVTNSSFFEYWEEGTPVSSPQYDLDFCKENNRGFFLFCIKDIVNSRIETRLNDNELVLNYRVVHTPTKCNFWHFSIRVILNDVNVDSLNISSNQKRKIWRTAKIMLTQLITLDVPASDELCKCHYIISA